MPTQLKWEDNFWGPEAGKGFTVLTERLDLGQQSLKEITDFYQFRTKTYTADAQELQKLIKSNPFKADQGSLQGCLQRITATEEILAKAKLQYSQQIQSELDGVINRQRENQKKIRKAFETELDKAVKNVQKEAANVDKLKKDYFTKCAEMAKAVQLAGKGQTGAMTKKEYEKIQERAIKAKKDTDAAEAEYKAAVKKLDQAQDVWDEKMAELAREYQKLEADRLQTTKLALLRMTDAHIEVVNKVQTEGFLKLKAVIETIDVDGDLDNYCRLLRTGESKPARTQFQNYFGASSGSTSATSGGAPNSPTSPTSTSAKLQAMKSQSGSAVNNVSQGGSVEGGVEDQAAAALIRLKTKIKSKGDLNNKSQTDLTGKGSVSDLRQSHDRLEKTISQNLAFAAASAASQKGSKELSQSASLSQSQIFSGGPQTPTTQTEKSAADGASYFDSRKPIEEESAAPVSTAPVPAVAGLVAESELKRTMDSAEFESEKPAGTISASSGEIAPSSAAAAAEKAPLDEKKKSLSNLSPVNTSFATTQSSTAGAQPPLDSAIGSPGNPDLDLKQAPVSEKIAPAAEEKQQQMESKKLLVEEALKKSMDKLNISGAPSPKLSPKPIINQSAVTSPTSQAATEKPATISSDAGKAAEPAALPSTLSAVKASKDNLASTSSSAAPAPATAPTTSTPVSSEPAAATLGVAVSFDDLPKKTFARKSIKMEGWLEIYESAPDVKPWSKSWCVLEGGYIWVYESQADANRPQGTTKPKAMISLAKSTFAKGVDPQWNVPSLDAHPNLFSLVIGGKRQIACSSGTEDYPYWTTSIESLNKKK